MHLAFAANRLPGATPRPGALDAQAIDEIVGHKSKVQDGVVKVSIGREGEMHGVVVGASMGLTAAAGAEAKVSQDGVVRIGWARTDVDVTVDGMLLEPFAGVGSWAAFTPSADGAIMMGDTVVFEDEVTPAMDAAYYWIGFGLISIR